MPAEADSFSLEKSLLSQNSKAVVFKISVLLHEVFNVLEALVDTIEAIVSCF